ncbi:hypothetical protein BDZ91DRAFT_791832 [Kalaharituber pfeilii]|nr:hypothetical protein BDZ91DRAFT_791832 [Kalaharituber pfeilii]
MPWATAKLNGVVIAETDDPQVVGGDVYVGPLGVATILLEQVGVLAFKMYANLLFGVEQFPPDCVKWEYLSASSSRASQVHYTLSVTGTTIPDAAWVYPDPQNRRLEPVKNHVAFVGMAPVMIMYKKNFRYARSDEARSDVSSLYTSGSTPNTSTPTTPTLGYSIPTIQLPYNPSIYDYRNSHTFTPTLSRMGSHCSATAGWKGMGLPSVPEVEGSLGFEICEER